MIYRRNIFALVFVKLDLFCGCSMTKHNIKTKLVMSIKLLSFLVLILNFIFSSDGFSRNPEINTISTDLMSDSITKKGLIFLSAIERQKIVFNKEQALKYLLAIVRNDNWNNNSDPLRTAIGQLIWFASNKPFDSTRNYLEKYAFDSIKVPAEVFFIWDTLKIRVPVVKDLQFKALSDTLAEGNTQLKKMRNDSLVLHSIEDLHGLRHDTVGSEINFKDTLLLLIADTLEKVVSSRADIPFKYYYSPYETDSIERAIRALIGFLDERDSAEINLTGISDLKMPVWINSKSDKMVRFWLRNEYSDSVTIWVGGVSRNTLGLYLEDGIIFRRPTKQSNIANAQLTLKQLNSSRLQDIKKIYIKPQYWKFRSESSFALNQTSLTNWVKGGESSISTSMDITGYANYEDKQTEVFSSNFARLKYGLIASRDNGVRKNMDLLETNSKLNHKAFGKFDFSAIMLFKTQIAKGYNYPNDSVPVSKFLNPAILTIGLGLDYKPNKSTSISFAPLSYKATFVTDTAGIDQTKYGISKGKRSLHEPGVSLLVSNEFKPFKTVSIINRLQLFTNYIHNPQNVDVDWEIIATASLNWFTDVRFNTQLIFDDDTRTGVFDKKGNPVLGPDGQQKKSARIQFKELLGFSFVFRF